MNFPYPWLILLLSCCLGLTGRAAELSESVITTAMTGGNISALVTHQSEHDRFRRAIVLLPGYPGIMRIESETAYLLKGNFLIRSRRFWLDRETIVFSVDAPSDQWASFTGAFRASQRYAEDLRGLTEAIQGRYGVMDWVIVGTSEGSISAYYAAKALPDLSSKVIFSASMFVGSRNSPGLASLDFKNFKPPMLWVHHAEDPCSYTPFSEAKRLAGQTGSPLIVVRSSAVGHGNVCQAFSRHGFIGAEEATVRAMKNWVLTGVVADVDLP
ncbi:MAG: hypothetical protein WBI20_07165 [Burkholderiaceae bacterium]